MRLPLWIVGCVALVSPAQGQGFHFDIVPADPAPAFAFAVSDATTPAQFQALVDAATPAEIESFLASASDAKIAAFVSLLGTANAATQRKVMLAVAARAGAMELKVNATDLDVLAAVFGFAAQDPRYDQIEPMSYFGVQLAHLQKQIAAEGMTPENKQQLLTLYHDATQALQAYLASEAVSAPH